MVVFHLAEPLTMRNPEASKMPLFKMLTEMTTVSIEGSISLNIYSGLHVCDSLQVSHLFGRNSFSVYIYCTQMVQKDLSAWRGSDLRVHK